MFLRAFIMLELKKENPYLGFSFLIVAMIYLLQIY